MTVNEAMNNILRALDTVVCNGPTHRLIEQSYATVLDFVNTHICVNGQTEMAAIAFPAAKKADE
jgi:hypothetical protein